MTHGRHDSTGTSANHAAFTGMIRAVAHGTRRESKGCRKMISRRKLAAGIGGLTLLLGTIGGGIAVHAASPTAQADRAEAPINPSLVTTTADQARAAVAAKYLGGTIGQVELQDENGALVWGVIVTDTHGKAHDVKVAGDSNQIVSDQSDDSVEAPGAGD